MRGNEREIDLSVLSPRNCKVSVLDVKDLSCYLGEVAGRYRIYGGVPKGGGLLYHGPNPYWSLAT